MSLLLASAGVSIASSVLGFGASRKARKRQRRAEALAAKRNTIINIQNQRAAAAAIRRQQAQQKVAALATGMAGGSGDRATRASIQSQGLASLATQQHQLELGGQVNSEIGRANRARGQAATFAAIGGLASNVATFAGGMESKADTTGSGNQGSALPTSAVDPNLYLKKGYLSH